jgi:long-chain acyl-CoA synthetase
VLVTKLLKLLEEVNNALAPFEQLAFLAIAKDVWSAENGFLTPTLKIKRKVLDATYGPLAENGTQ